MIEKIKELFYSRNELLAYELMKGQNLEFIDLDINEMFLSLAEWCGICGLLLLLFCVSSIVRNAFRPLSPKWYKRIDFVLCVSGVCIVLMVIILIIIFY